MVSDLCVRFDIATEELTLNRYCSSMSDSSLVTPKMRRVKPLLTKTPFHPVTAEFSQYHSCIGNHWNTYDLFGSPGGLPPTQSRGSAVILEGLFSVDCPVSRLLRGRTLHRVWRSESPSKRPLKATSGRKFRTSMSRASDCQYHFLPESLQTGIHTVSPPVFGSVWIFNIA